MLPYGSYRKCTEKGGGAVKNYRAMKVRGKRFLPLLILFLALAGALCYGAVRTGGEIWSRLETGGVKIGVETFCVEDGQKVKMDPRLRVDCRQPVSYVPRITNRGTKCYLRVRLLGKAGSQVFPLQEELDGVGEGWLQKGEYLYYEKPVSYGEAIDVCQAFRLPDRWDFYQDKTLQVQVDADAVQDKNFHPDFSLEHPWGEVVVTASRFQEDNRIEVVEPADPELQETQGNACRITADETQGLLLGEEGFFSHVVFLPGDSRTETLQLSNQETHRIQILMKAEWEKSAFLDQMQLQISGGDQSYDGVLTGAELRDYRTLATLEPGESRAVHVTLSFPETADNPLQQNSDDIRWSFAVKQEEKPWDTPATGDAGIWWIFFAAGCVSIAVAGMLLRKRR